MCGRLIIQSFFHTIIYLVTNSGIYIFAWPLLVFKVEDCTVSRDSSNLLILVYIEANVDPLKKSFAHLQIRHGVVDSIAVSHAEIMAWLHGVLIPPVPLKKNLCIFLHLTFLYHHF